MLIIGPVALLTTGAIYMRPDRETISGVISPVMNSYYKSPAPSSIPLLKGFKVPNDRVCGASVLGIF